jgi:hypothetical protein
VPQGDVLSPWLFNLFIESLVRTLQADTVFTGVDAFGLNVKELLYADDLALLCTTRAQVQRGLDIVTTWCDNWGMQVSTGKKKTEVLVFYPNPPPGAAAAAVPPAGDAAPFKAGAADVEVTSDYRYLGHEINSRLEFEPIIERYASKMCGQLQPLLPHERSVEADVTAGAGDPAAHLRAVLHQLPGVCPAC